MAPTASDIRSEQVVARASTSRWLRNATDTAHREVESRIDLGQVRRVADLAALLNGWTMVWRAVDASTGTDGDAVGPVDLLGHAATQAIGWLGADLRELTDRVGTDPHRVDAAPQIDGRVTDELRRVLARPAGAWGVAYVLLGSRLGGSVIAAHVRETLALGDGIGTSYLASSGTNPSRDWNAFRLCLDDAPLTAAERDVCAEAARWTFRLASCVVGGALAGGSGTS